MKPIRTSLSLIALLASTAAMAQQMYKWTGADGKVNYTDTPPPASAKRAETKAVDGAGSPVENLPYEVAQAVKASPVTLYTTTTCAACDTARTFLKKRGIPFAEKTVTTAEDAEQLKQAGGDGSLPLLTIGRAKQIGFEGGAWNGALNAAGYPESSKLPPSYRNPQATAAAPIVAKEVKSIAKVEPAPPAERSPKAINDKAPPGFRF